MNKSNTSREFPLGYVVPISSVSKTQERQADITIIKHNGARKIEIILFKILPRIGTWTKVLRTSKSAEDLTIAFHSILLIITPDQDQM